MIRFISAIHLASASVLRDILVLRLYGLAAQGVVLLVAVFLLHADLPLFALLTVWGASALFAGWTAFRLRHDWPVTLVECFVQLLTDVLLLTLLLYFSGGAANPFVSLYLLPIIVGATALPVRLAWVLSFAGIAAYSTLMAWHEPLVLPAGSAAFHLHVLGMWLNFILSAILITYFIGRMAQGLRRRDQQLAHEREQRLRDEQIVALGSLAAGTAHELSTPLATMNIIAGELMDEYAHDEGLAEQLALMRSQVVLCKQALTRLSRADKTGRSESSEVMGLQDWLEAQLGLWQVMRPRVRLTVRWLRQGQQPRLIAGDILGQALLNLCNNAADAGNNQVEIEIAWDANRIQIDILDRGEGFPEQVGTAFVTTKREHGGSGIGLLLANASIEQYGGQVSLLARDGGGARVMVSLPVFEPDAGELR